MSFKRKNQQGGTDADACFIKRYASDSGTPACYLKITHRGWIVLPLFDSVENKQRYQNKGSS